MDLMTRSAEANAVAGLTRRVVLWAAGTTLLAGPVRSAPAQAGSVNDVRGECFVDAAERRQLAASAPVFVGDMVATGKDSQLGLMLGTRTRIKLGANSRLKIDKFLPDLGGELVLERGALRAAHEPGSNSGLSINSPFGLLAVRGTDFFAGTLDGVFGVFVERGVVTVTGGNKTVTVTANKGTTILRPGGRPSEPAVWKAPRLRRARALVERI
jgi:hypothetical protein